MSTMAIADNDRDTITPMSISVPVLASDLPMVILAGISLVLIPTGVSLSHLSTLLRAEMNTNADV